MKNRARKPPNDYREFVFTATREIDLKRIDMIDVADNISAELHRLEALSTLLQCVEDAIEPNVASGLGVIIKDSCRRMHVIIEAGLASSRVGQTRRPSAK